MHSFTTYSVRWLSLASGKGMTFFSCGNVSDMFNHHLVICRILLQLRYQLSDAGWLDSTHAQALGVSIFIRGIAVVND